MKFWKIDFCKWVYFIIRNVILYFIINITYVQLIFQWEGVFNPGNSCLKEQWKHLFKICSKFRLVMWNHAPPPTPRKDMSYWSNTFTFSDNTGQYHIIFFFFSFFNWHQGRKNGCKFNFFHESCSWSIYIELQYDFTSKVPDSHNAKHLIKVYCL